MRLKINKEDDSLYFRLDDSDIIESEEVHPGVVLDFNKEGKVVGVEMLKISERMKPEQMKILQYESS